MTKYFIEEDDISMDVQVGPKGDEDVSVKPEDAVPTPVDVAKADPGNIVVAAVKADDEYNKDDGEEDYEYKETPKCEFYVDVRDLALTASLNEWNIVDAANALFECHADEGMTARNTIFVFESDLKDYADELMEAGAVCAINEEDMEMDVQVGPNDEELSMSSDMDAVNPLDVVKNDYDKVVVAKNGDKFFMDVEDVQKCSDLNCESAISTLNGIIAAHEDAGMSADNIVIVCDESCNLPCMDEFKSCKSRINLMVR